MKPRVPDLPGDAREAVGILQELLDGFLDGTLTTEQVETVERLCREVPECAKERELALLARESLRSVKVPAVPSSVSRQVLAQVRRKAFAAWRDRVLAALAFVSLPVWRPVLAVATLVIAVWLTFSVVRRPDIPIEPETYSRAEIDRALEEVKWTLGYLGQVGRKTGTLVRDDVLEPHVVSPISNTILSAIETPN